MRRAPPVSGLHALARLLGPLVVSLSSLGLAVGPLGCGAPPRGTIGAVLGRRADGRIFLRDVPGHLAAGQAGLQPDDELLLVDGRDVRHLGESELRDALEGEIGQEVKLTLLRQDEVVRVTLKRTAAEPYRLP